jgi:hypothetical protein
MSAECSAPRKKINWAEVTCSICNEKGHGRKRCPQAEGEQGADGANAGFDTGAAATTANGGWGPVATGSAQAPWETDTADNAYAAPAPAEGSW